MGRANGLKVVLHDFTTRELEGARQSEDSLGMMGVFSCPEDLFSVLGRDPALTDLLQDVDMLEHGRQYWRGPQDRPPGPGPVDKEEKPIEEFLAKVGPSTSRTQGQPPLLEEA